MGAGVDMPSSKLIWDRYAIIAISAVLWVPLLVGAATYHWPGHWGAFTFAGAGMGAFWAFLAERFYVRRRALRKTNLTKLP